MNDKRRPLPRNAAAHITYPDCTAIVRRLPAPAVIYRRSAEIEQLAVVYLLAGHERRHELGTSIAGHVEWLADMKAAA